MAFQTATSDYIDFLCRRGGVTHVISAAPDSGLSTLSLTQHCLDCGIAFPVPLPDGSVAIDVAGEIPSALTDLGVVISEVPGAGRAAPDGRDESPAASRPEVAETEGAVPEAEQPEPAFEADIDVSPIAADDPALSDAPVPDMDGEGPPDLPADGCEAPEGLPVEAVGEDGAADDCATDVDRHLDAPDGAEPTPEPSPVSRDEETAALPEEPDRMQELLDVLTDVEVRIDALAQDQVRLAARFDAFSRLLEEMAARPAPRPDATEFNRSMARMTSAFAQAMRRIDDALDSAPVRRPDADLGRAVSTGLAALVDAIRSLESPAGKGAAPDLTEIAEMQQALSRQLAEVRAAQQATRPPAMEEFLLDLRHATAELLAEQARVAGTG